MGFRAKIGVYGVDGVDTPWTVWTTLAPAVLMTNPNIIPQCKEGFHIFLSCFIVMVYGYVLSKGRGQRKKNVFFRALPE